MRKIHTIIITSLIFGALISAEGTDNIPERTVELTYVGSVTDIPEATDYLELWIPLAHSNTHQVITDVDVTSPFPYDITTSTEYGNMMVYVEVDDPPAGFDVIVSFTVKRHADVDGLRNNDKPEVNEALGANRLIPLTDDINKIALKAVGDTVDNMTKGLALYNHTYDHLTYDKTGEGWGLGDFNHACDIGRGNCTDFHSYFIGLARNIDIPAYFEIGVSLPAEYGEGKTGSYHCWAHFWGGEYWVPVDISEADKHPELKDYFFGNHDENRIAFSRGRDLILTPQQKGEPLNFFIDPYAEVNGEPFYGVSKEVFYKDILDR